MNIIKKFVSHINKSSLNYIFNESIGMTKFHLDCC